MPAKQACDRFVPHLFLSNNLCRDCGFPESDHIFIQASGRGRAPTLEQKIDLAVKDAVCTVYTPHAWLVDTCRDCRRPETEHETSAVVTAVEEDNKKGRTVNTGKFRKEEEIAASLGINSKNNSRRSSTQAPASQATSSNGLQIRGKGAVNGLRSAQKVMDHAVDQMVLMNQELEDAKQVEGESLQSKSISQDQYDAKMAEIQAAFAKKEAELRAQVEQAKQQIQEAEQQLKAEQQQQQQQQTETPRIDSNTAQQHSEELERIRGEAEQARAEAAALRAQAAQAQEAVAAAQGKAAQEREQLERQRQAEIEAARLEAQAARQEAAAIKAEAAAQREQLERERQRQQEEATVAAATVAAAAVSTPVVSQQKPTEEEKEQTPASVPTPAVVPVPISTVISPSTAPATTTPTTSSSSTDDDEEDAQPTSVGSTTESVGPYAGTVNLNDVLLKVEKLFLSGKNYFRFCYSKSAVIISSVFLRVINDEYVLCWSKSNARSVHQSRTLPFSSIRSIVIGKQSSVFQRHEFQEAAAAQCFSILGEQHSLHLMAANERDAEMTAFGLASLMKESRLTVNVYDFNQYREPEKALIQQTQQEQTEEEDGSPTVSSLDVEQLSTHQTALSSAPKFLLQFSVKCSNLPLTHFNTIVCLVDRDEKTDRLVYISQTEKIQRTHSPEFVKQFELEYERNHLPKQIRFNVYDVNIKSTQIEDDDRVGSVRVDVNEMVDFDGVDFVYLLSHKDHAKNHKLLTNRSLITVRITKKSLLKRNSISGAHTFDATELTHLQSVLQSGDIFTSYTEHQPSYPLTLYYRIQPNAEYKTQQAAEQNFVLGNLYYTVHNNEESGSNSARGKNGQQKALATKTELLPLRSICDVYVGKKHRSFGPNAKDECCLSLLSKTGVRLDLEAKNRIQRDEFVNAVTGLLKHASNEAKKKATAKLGIAK